MDESATRSLTLRDGGAVACWRRMHATTPRLIHFIFAFALCTSVATAVQEDCDVIGLSVLSGAHEPIAKKILDLLRARNVSIPILMGGVIPPEDRARLRALGVGAIFGQEATLAEIVDGVRRLARGEKEAGA